MLTNRPMNMELDPDKAFDRGYDLGLADRSQLKVKQLAEELLERLETEYPDAENEETLEDTDIIELIERLHDAIPVLGRKA